VAKKSRLVMQILADVMNLKVSVPAGDQVVALGAAMFAATACGLYPSIEAAQKAMAGASERTYRPDPDRVRHYDRVYQEYLRLGAFMENA